MEVLGRTECDKPILKGIFKYYETYGIPLDIVMYMCKEKGIVPCPVNLLADMIDNGMDKHKACRTILELFHDAYRRNPPKGWVADWLITINEFKDDKYLKLRG